MESTGRIKLLSSDDVVVEVDLGAAVMSVTIRKMLDDIKGEELGTVPLSMTGLVLKSVMDYCTEAIRRPDQVSAYAPGRPVDDFCDLDRAHSERWKVDKKLLADVLSASLYLNIDRLTQVAARTIAALFRRTPVAECCRAFGMIEPTLYQVYRAEHRHEFIVKT
jgi:hypothetical protein